MKKIISIFLMLIIVLSVTGCDKKEKLKCTYEDDYDEAEMTIKFKKGKPSTLKACSEGKCYTDIVSEDHRDKSRKEMKTYLEDLGWECE